MKRVAAVLLALMLATAPALLARVGGHGGQGHGKSKSGKSTHLKKSSSTASLYM
jgi:hypothetical protein